MEPAASYPSKHDSRLDLRRIITGLPLEYRDEASARICKRLMELPAIRAAREAHCYWPRTAAGEVDIRPVIEWMLSLGTRVFLPVVVRRSHARGPSPRVLESEFGDPALLARGHWSILEPPHDHARPFASDVAIVPGLGVGRNGVRVGQGWGFYDELLENAAVPIVMPCFEACVVGAVPARRQDVLPTIVVTEDRTLVNTAGRLTSGDETGGTT